MDDVLNLIDSVDDLASKKDVKMMLNKIYSNLLKNIKVTLDQFILFNEEDVYISIPQHKGYRSKVIDKLVSYFEHFEEYEKCSKLIALRIQVIEAGD